MSHEQLGFAREANGEAVAVLLNAADRAIDMTVPAPRDGEWRDLLNGGSFRTAGDVLRADVPASWGRILRPI